VFTRAARGWRQTAELASADTGAGNEFGYSVALSGRTVVAGAGHDASGAGRAYVFNTRPG